MKINFKARFKNPIFIAQLFLSVAAPIGAYYGIAAPDVTTWPALLDLLLAAVSNPFVVFTIVVGVWSAVNDPLTAGPGDSRQGLTYSKPKNDRLNKGAK